MMRNRKTAVAAISHIILPAMMLGTVTAAGAQERLNEHVAVDGRYLPEVIRTERLRSPLSPLEMKFGSSPTEAALTGEPVDFAPSLMAMPPTVWRASGLQRPEHGYVDLTLGSWLDGRLLAGVRALNRDNTWLDIRFDGLSTALYKPENAWSRRRRLEGTLGADLTSRFDDRGTLSASLQYHLGWFNYDLLKAEPAPFPQPEPTEDPHSPTQTVNDASLRIGWQSDRSASFRWNAGAAMRMFAYRAVPFSTLTPTRETSVRLDGGIDGDVGLGSTSSDWGLGLAAALNTYAGDVRPSTNGLITLTPAWNIARPFEEGRGGALRWEARIGARVDFSFNHRGPFAEYIFLDEPYEAVGGDGAERFGFLHFAPDCSFSLSNGTIGARFTATGGVEEQTLSALADADPYAAPVITGSLPAYTPADLRLGVILTPGAGFSAELEGRWKSTRSIYAGGLWTAILADRSVRANDNATVGVPYASAYYSLHGFSARLAAEWKAWRYLEAGVEATWQPQTESTGWFNGYDRPEWTVAVALTSRPWRSLRIDVDWELRAKRNITLQGPMFDDYGIAGIMRPGNLSDLSAGISYEFTPRLSVGVRLTNILDRKTQLAPGFISEGFGATGGLQFLF